MKKIVLPVLLVLTGSWLRAQEEVTSEELQRDNSGWQVSPWLWVIGAALVIVLLVAMTKEKK